MDKFDLDFSLVLRLTGHSKARSYRTKDQMPGMAITYALIRMVEKMAEVSDRARVVTKALVTELLVRDGQVVGCQYTTLEVKGLSDLEDMGFQCVSPRFTCFFMAFGRVFDGLGFVSPGLRRLLKAFPLRKSGRSRKEYGPVVLTTGGYAATGAGSLLCRLRPELLGQPTASTSHHTGDGVVMAEKLGARALDLEPQLHNGKLQATEKASFWWEVVQRPWVFMGFHRSSGMFSRKFELIVGVDGSGMGPLASHRRLVFMRIVRKHLRIKVTVK